MLKNVANVLSFSFNNSLLKNVVLMVGDPKPIFHARYGMQILYTNSKHKLTGRCAIS